MRASVALALCMIAAASLVAPVRADDAKSGDKPRATHKITQNESYIGFDPMYATVLDSGEPVGLLLVSIGLDVPDPKLRAEVNDALPLLRDAYVRSLMIFTAAAVRPYEQPDVDLIARRLQGVTNRVLRKPGARVLLGQVMLRIAR